MDVCDECVDEQALQEFIRDNAVSESCDFCGRESDEPIACDFDDFKEVFAAGIAVDWADALNFMPRDGDHWALEDAHRDIYDLLVDGELDVELNEALFQRVVEEFIDISYAPRYYFDLAPEEALQYGWEAFVSHVSHRTRFFFAGGAGVEEDHDPREISPADMMTALGRVIAERGRVRPLPVGTLLHRARLHRRGDPPPAGAKQLGTPPVEFARYSNPWGALTWSHAAAASYSWMSPPSRSWRRIAVGDPRGPRWAGGIVRGSGACRSSARCGLCSL